MLVKQTRRRCKSLDLLNALLLQENTHKKKVNLCLKWLKEKEISHIVVWGLDTTTGEGSQIRMWYNEEQDRYYGLLSTGAVRSCSPGKLVYNHIVSDTFDFYDEEGVKLYQEEESIADTIGRHLQKVNYDKN